MDSNKWLEFTVFTGIEKYKSIVSNLIKNSKKFKNSFDYMRLISVIYLSLEDMVDQVKDIL